MQPIGQQQRTFGQLTQELVRQFPFRLAGSTDGGGQRIVPADFQQHARGQLGKGGAAPPALGLLEGRLDLGGVGQAERRAVQRQQTPRAPERFGMSPAVGPRSQCPLHQLGEDLPGQTRATIRPRTVGQRLVEEFQEMLGERAGAIHEVEDEGRQELGQWHARFSAAAFGDARHSRSAQQFLECRHKTAGCIGRRGEFGSTL
jgi:peptidoglycan hydrolase-like protein with peptidoglycan-binding domain